MDNHASLNRKLSSERQRTMSSNWVTFEAKPFWVTTIMVNHPFLIHLGMLCLAIGALLLSDLSLLSKISLEIVLPDRDFWTDGMCQYISLNTVYT